MEGIADRLPDEDREMFTKMLYDCYKYSNAINAKGLPSLTEPVIMALLFSQHKLIEWLEKPVLVVDCSLEHYFEKQKSKILVVLDSRETSHKV